MSTTFTAAASSDVVGRHVQFSLGRKVLEGTVVADRGPIGRQKKRQYTVHVPAEPFDPIVFELMEDEVEFVEERPRPLPTKEQIIDFLKSGGLALILRSNMSRSQKEPRVWLCLDRNNNVTHTFRSSVGGLGGQSIPRGALYEDSVPAPLRSQVVDFVQSFGLSQSEAEDVVNSVAPEP